MVDDILYYCAYFIIHGYAAEFKRNLTVTDNDLKNYTHASAWVLCTRSSGVPFT